MRRFPTSAILALSLAAAACATGPTESERAKGRELARRCVLVDGHIDVPYRLSRAPADVSRRTPDGDFDAERAREGGLDAPFLSIYVPSSYESSGGAKAFADGLIDGVERLANEHPSVFAIARSADEVRAIAASGRVALLLGMENGSPIERDLRNVDHFYRRGVRYVTLCHAEDNHLCDSSYDARHSAKGLTPFGREVVRRMNDLGILVDISHVSDDTARQVLALSRAPVIASHSGCRVFTPGWERNLSDELIRAVAAGGGVVMINFGSSFLRDDLRRAAAPLYAELEAEKKARGWSGSEPEAEAFEKKFFTERKVGYADVADVANHIDHVVRVAGIDHVGLGSDFDGVGDSLPNGLKDVSEYPNLFAELLHRGYDETAIEKIAGGNALRALAAAELLASGAAGNR